jgi:hypothetical protein
VNDCQDQVCYHGGEYEDRDNNQTPSAPKAELEVFDQHHGEREEGIESFIARGDEPVKSIREWRKVTGKQLRCQKGDL